MKIYLFQQNESCLDKFPMENEDFGPIVEKHYFK